MDLNTLHNYQHVTVLLEESIEALAIKPDGVYVDCTLGGGGHSKLILSKLGPKGKLICFDHDKDAWPNAPKDNRVLLVKENFLYLKRFLKYHQFPKVDGILADIGVSSFHFDTGDRGFSIRFDAILDMRMDNRLEQTAADIVNTYSEEALHQLFEINGEVRNAKTLAKAIVNGRNNRKVVSIADFKSLIEECIKGNPNKYLAQVFQALRIEVNQELVNLQLFLEQTVDCLKEDGILAIITFHSLEDRIVKRFMKQPLPANVDDVFGNAPLKKIFEVKKDVLPTDQEILNNPRSRSARLRIAKRLKD